VSLKPAGSGESVGRWRGRRRRFTLESCPRLCVSESLWQSWGFDQTITMTTTTATTAAATRANQLAVAADGTQAVS